MGIWEKIKDIGSRILAFCVFLWLMAWSIPFVGLLILLDPDEELLGDRYY